ncbi:hypothetical protein ACFV2X_25430, partial [Streptomyces sp. NPDC059679]|uniref:hypothetical protein n=1 Tax=Streptomyces sp. NPDC059679 TaxID=3346903 RepID=UPI0036ACAD13
MQWVPDFPNRLGIKDGKGHWRRIGGPAAKIYTGGAGLFATSPQDGRIFRYDGDPDKWTEI